MDINRSAPLQVTRQIVVDCPADAIWDLVSDVENWPSWNPDVHDVVAADGVRPGAQFTWKAGPGGITSTFVRVDKPVELGWTGHTMGINAVHVYRFQPDGDRTTVITEESWDGLPVRLLRRRAHHMLVTAVESGLTHLQAAAARRRST